jgi:tetratricopeptide (TPR) repeat protein
VTGPGGEQRPEPLAREALDLVGEYQRTGDLRLLAAAVPALRAALASALACRAPDPAAYHGNLAYALRLLARAASQGEAAGEAAGAGETGSAAAALAEAAASLRAAVAAASPDDPDRAGYLCALASGLRDLYRATGDAGLLREAVSAATQARDLHLPEPSMGTRYAVLAGALGDLYEHDRDTALLPEAVNAAGMSASFAELTEDPETAQRWDFAAACLREQFMRTGDVAALAEGVRFSRRAVAASSGDQRLGCLSGLGDVLRLRFERTGDTGALAEAVAAGRTAVAGTWPGNPDLPRRAVRLADALASQYDRTGDAAALAGAITAARQAVAAAAPGDSERAGYLASLETVLALDGKRTGDPDTLAEAVRVAREAVAATPPGHRRRRASLAALASAAGALQERTGSDELLAEAIEACRDTLAAASAGDPAYAASLFNLGDALRARFRRTGDAGALDEAVRLTRAAIAATPADHPDRTLWLAGLSNLLTAVAELTGDAGPLAEAVAAARAAVAAISEDDPSRPVLLDDLGSALTALAAHTRDSSMLAEAVRVRREALAATPDGHASRVARLVNLAGSARALAGRAADPQAVMEAARLVAQALEALPADHPDRVICLSSLAGAYRDLVWYFPSPQAGYLDDAIRYARETVAATPADHAGYADRLAAISLLLLRKSDVTKDPGLLAEALDLGRQAVSATAPDSPQYGRYLDQLGMALYARYQAASPPGAARADAAEAWACFREAGRRPRVSVIGRIDSYQRAAEIAADAGRTPQEALACIEAAADLLPGVLPGDLDRADQEHEIAEVAHLASHAAQAAVAAGQPDRAVELLERTRGVLSARELDRLAGRDRRESLTIREIGALAAAGPLVYVYSGLRRCDALILAPGPGPAGAGRVRVVPLGIEEAEAWEKADRFTALVGLGPDDAAPDPASPAAQREILAILGWLRERVTGPVLAALGYDRLPAAARDRPRVWWCPVGIFTFLPLHAACLDEVVSSYAATARSLRHARSRPPPAAGAASAPLIVAVPGAPGMAPLPGAGLEADLIAAAFPRALRLRRPARTAVLAALPGHPVAHFACHGGVEADEPGRSRLYLDDHAQAPLTLADIAALRLDGGLAFLSACETAVTTESLSNESVHLAAAFQLAGYQHVVGTLWPAGDQPLARLVRDFYPALAPPGHRGVIDVSRAATALNHATRLLRARYPDWPAHWAGYLHAGP